MAGAGFGGSVKLTGESNYRKALQAITQSLKEVDSELKLVGTQFDKNDKSEEALSAQSDALAKKFETQGEKIKLLISHYKEMESQSEKSKEKHEALKKELETATAELSKIEKESGKASEAYQSQARYVSALASEFEKSEKNISSQEVALSKMRTEINKAETDLVKTGKAIGDLDEEMDKTADSSDEMGDEIVKAGNDAKQASNEGFTVMKGVLADLASTVIKNAISGLADLGSAIVGLGKESITSFAEYEQLVGGAQKIFDEMDYSQIATDASNAYKELNMSASEYIEAINQSGATFAQTMGDQKGYETARTGLQAIADYASGTGKSVDELTQKYAMITRSTSSYQSIADQFSGILPQTSADFLATAQSAGLLASSYQSLTEVPVDEYQQAVTAMLEMGVDNLGLAGNTAMETANTISGSLASVSATWSNLITGLSDDNADLDSLIDNFADSLLTAVDLIAPRIQHFVSSAGQVVSELLETLIPELASELPSFLQTFIPVLNGAVYSIITEVLDILPELTSIFSKLIPQAVKKLISLAPQLLSAGLQCAVEILNGLSEGLPDIIAMIPDLIEGLVLAVNDNLESILTAGISILEAVITGINETLPTLIDLIPDLILTLEETILDNLPMIVTAGAKLTASLISGLVSNGSDLLVAMSDLIVDMSDVLADHWDEISELGADFIEKIVEGLKSVWTKITDKAQEIYDTIHNKVDELREKLKSIAINMIVNFVTGINDKIQSVKNKAQEIFDGVKDKVVNLPTELKTIATNMLTDMITGISDKISSLKSSAQDIFDNIYDEISSLPSDMLSIGENIVEGLIDGIDNMADWAVDKITSFADDITEGLCEFLGIQSPSKVYKGIGEFMAEGLGIGFGDEMDSVSQEMQDAIPTSFDTDINGSIAGTGGLDTTYLVRAFKEALSEMKIELDDREVGQFIDKTVTQAIYN